SGTAITDGALDALSALPALETISLAWTAVTDAGAARLAACRQLRSVNLIGTNTGDGAIAALASMPHLHAFRSGNGVTDAGLAFLHDIPVFKTWRAGPVEMGLTSADAQPNYLLLRGSFTDAGFAQLVGLEGLFALNLDSSDLQLTGNALEPLIGLP